MDHLHCCHPLLHKYIVQGLTILVVQGRLVGHKQAMWEGLALDILSDPTNAYHSLLDFMKLTATRHAPVAQEAVDCPGNSLLPL
jgi:hypothetical protein